jgi:chemotaxis protein methyltransferase CheR
VNMTTQDFDFIRALVKEEASLILDDKQTYLGESRLAALVVEAGCSSYAGMIEKIKTDPIFKKRAVEAMLTHETLFFRDLNPFDAIRTKLLPELIAKRAAEKKLSIWSAACSSGQEPYSIAIVLRENFPELADWNVQIWATDLSDHILARAAQGVYSQIEINRGLPALLLVKYFEKWGTEWKLKDSIRNMVSFKQMNLTKPWPALPIFDLVLLRNVMIYFDIPTKKWILTQLREQMRKDGYLILGGAETTMNIDNSFERCGLEKTSFYFPKAA